MSGTAARQVRRMAVEHLADAAQTKIVKVMLEGAQVTQRRCAVVIDVIVRLDKRADQPAPHCALMIRTIARIAIACEDALITLMRSLARGREDTERPSSISVFFCNISKRQEKLTY